TIIGYPLQALGFACLVIAALSPTSFLYRVRIPATATIARLSYALYLTHLPMLILLKYIYYKKLNMDPFSFEGVLITASVLLFTAYTLYMTIEQPCLKMRNKYCPSIAPELNKYAITSE
ncbi:MAG: hypothetical protein K0U12_04780, partial [Gammaproteobacteria bacterium]|nr:hypothetical protein [Gammaproteobacteria bacterium]